MNKKKNFVFTPGSGPLLRLHNKAIPRDEPYGTCAYFSSRYDLACELAGLHAGAITYFCLCMKFRN